MKEALGEGGLHSPHSLPVGRTEVGAKCKAYLEEEVLCKDVREGACHVRVMLDLAEA